MKTVVQIIAVWFANFALSLLGLAIGDAISPFGQPDTIAELLSKSYYWSGGAALMFWTMKS